MLYTNLLNVVQRFRNSQIGITECPYKDTLRLESKNEIDELLRAPLDYCIPSVSVDSEVVNCTDAKGQPNHTLIMHIFPSPQVHANQADEVYMRVGDKSKKLNFDQRLQLLFSKSPPLF